MKQRARDAVFLNFLHSADRIDEGLDHRGVGALPMIGDAVLRFDPATGVFIASVSPEAQQFVKPIKQREDNVTAVRMFNLLSSYTGESRYREIAEAGMGYLTSPPILNAFGFLPDVLLTEDELRNEPPHITIVGAKDDPRSSLRFTRPPWPIRSPTSVRSGGTSARASLPISTSTTPIIPVVPPPSPARARSAVSGHRARRDLGAVGQP
jgi:hypothetical protein